jgi:hypothetical protein
MSILRNFKTFFTLLLGIIIGLISFWCFTQYQQTSENHVRKEVIICGSTINARCFKYRCENGYLPQIPPPSGSGRCSDGTTPVQLEEVESKS